MNHDEAIGARATERYFLSELPDGERDAFEEHYFECAVCADDVRSASALVGGLRASGRRENPFAARQAARARRNFTMPLAVAASVLLALLGYTQLGIVNPQTAALAEARQPGFPTKYTLRAVRAEEQEAVKKSNGPIELDVEIPPESKAASGTFTCGLVDAQGRPHGKPFTVPVPSEGGGFVAVVVPGSALPTGDYTLRIDGITPPVAPYRFTVR